MIKEIMEKNDWDLEVAETILMAKREVGDMYDIITAQPINDDANWEAYVDVYVSNLKAPATYVAGGTENYKSWAKIATITIPKEDSAFISKIVDFKWMVLVGRAEDDAFVDQKLTLPVIGVLRYTR